MDSGVTATPEELREVEALLRLKERSGLGERGIKKLVDSCGSGARSLRLSGDQMDLLDPRRSGPPLATWLEEGLGVLPMTSTRYPPCLHELVDPPPVLFLRGNSDLLHTEPSVAIVGSRRATGAGRRAAETMGRILAEAGVAVVSGMALGIDGAAHRGALAGGGKTVAVLGSGLRKVYPASHRDLFREIGSRGLLVSEFLPDESALPHHFPKRNRIIAALSQAIIVVEAGGRSGALITVDHGLDLGRDVFAIPGSVENPQSAGSNALLRDGAQPLVDPGGVLEELEAFGVRIGDRRGGEAQPRDVGSGVPSELRFLWGVLTSEPLTVEEVARCAAVPVAEALAGLSTLELGGWARQCPGSRFQRG